MFGYLYSDELWTPAAQSYSVKQTEDEGLARIPAIPTWAWDEYVEGQRDRTVRVIVDEDERVLAFPIPPNPPPILLDVSVEDFFLYNQNRYQTFNYDYEDFWNPVLISTINFFDDFEPDYSNVSVQRFQAPFFSFEDEGPQIYPVPIQIGFLNAQFDDWDWNQYFSKYLGQGTSEEDVGFPPIFSFFVVSDDDFQGSNWSNLVFVLQDLSYEDFSSIADFPPPPVPNQEFNEEVSWQHYLETRLSQGTDEEGIVLNAATLLPPTAWDDWDWARDYSNIYAGTQFPDFEDQTGGWFIIPPVPPPPFCPLPPLGPDADTSISVFGGRQQPILALFCRICKSGKPLVVRADYAIWCQDCCAFVSKQDTYMGTVRAPGQFRGTF